MDYLCREQWLGNILLLPSRCIIFFNNLVITTVKMQYEIDD